MASRALTALRRALPILLFLVLLMPMQASKAAQQQIPIDHIIVLYEENRSFDNYFGTYPGVNGLDPNITLPASLGSLGTVSPFHLSSLSTKDLSHSHSTALEAWDGGRMDGFVYAEGSNLTMGYYDYRDIPYYWDYASQFVLCDNFFTSEMGPSLPNHLYLIAGQSGGLYENSDNFSLDIPVIMDELDSKGISWRYYYNGPSGYSREGLWNPLPGIQSIRDNATRLENLAPNEEFLRDLQARRLASVSWVMPLSEESEHPPSNIGTGEHYIVNLVNAVMQSPYWNTTVIFITWDDYGGWYDHVPPPQLDSFGLGFRVPCLILSPYARAGYIDHQQNDFCSILKFIETRYGLPPLTARDSGANAMLEAFDFGQQPRAPLVLPGPYIPNHYPLTLANPPPIDYTPLIATFVAVAVVLVILVVLLILRGRPSNSAHG